MIYIRIEQFCKQNYNIFLTYAKYLSPNMHKIAKSRLIIQKWAARAAHFGGEGELVGNHDISINSPKIAPTNAINPCIRLNNLKGFASDTIVSIPNLKTILTCTPMTRGIRSPTRQIEGLRTRS